MRRRALFALVAILAVSVLVLAPSPGSARVPLPRSTVTTIGDEPAFDTTGRRPANAVHSPGEMGDDDGFGGGRVASSDVPGDDSPAVASVLHEGSRPHDVLRQFLRVLAALWLVR